MAQCVRDQLDGRFDCVTWAPLSARRLRQRGYDQARLLAEEAARVLEEAGRSVYLCTLSGGRSLAETLNATLIQNGTEQAITLSLPNLTREERDIILSGCLINYYNAEA